MSGRAKDHKVEIYIQGHKEPKVRYVSAKEARKLEELPFTAANVSSTRVTKAY